MDLNLILLRFKLGIGVAIMGVLWWYVLVPFIRYVKAPIQLPEQPDTAPLKNKQTTEISEPQEEHSRQHILEAAKADPQKTAHLVKSWLRE